MHESRPGARSARAVLCTFLFSLLAVSCMRPEGPAAGSGPTLPPIPSIQEGGVLRRGDTPEARRLLEKSRTALASGAVTMAQAAADSVVELYPHVPGSAKALEYLAEAFLQVGRYADAVDSATRYADLLGPGHPELSRVLLLRARGLAESGEGEDALGDLLRLPPGLAPAEMSRAREVFRTLADSLSVADLRAARTEAGSGHPLQADLEAALAVGLLREGEREEAERWARAALELGLARPEEEIARAVLERRADQIVGLPVLLGAILPRSGVSPGLMEYSQWIYEGIQVAAEEFRADFPQPVDVEAVDDRGGPLGGRIAVRTLQSSGALGAVGPLTQEILEAAASEREGPFPLISPFSFLPPEEAPGVYSLSGPDPGGARALADYARELGLEKVVVVRPATESAGVDARAFQEAFRDLGGLVPREIVFDSGATFFQPQFEEVASLLPDGIFLPLGPRDIELLAPQVTFYGLDTLGIQILGTAGWARDEVVLNVDSRHTDGVIAATTRTTQDETEAFQAFRTAYEALFQQTLRSEVPAFGYDAAALLLEALKDGPRSSEELVRSLEGVRDFPGATGRLTIQGGRIMREPHLVRIQDHELIYISSR